ncbi:uncharacterized mitochondrial protein AtMg00310-like [Juglans microcarpa x Juglans regia]|uniref:uncharacterized mitochondrial protein AtMg00310-like n=1 Tax=Juglans microcarpa x Juglans regia TaxID=2249226 RepID=UPI001B7F2B4F|nr:uncharacterized mitochondrial protein AtMg00310-like [Juglans microcarpa x Juglans regia]
MNVFRLPRKLSIEINSMIARFWWSNKKEGKGIHWKSWGKMGENKKGGRMGFRDVNMFNKAMLAKQGWMLQHNVNSMAAKIFKEKYYKQSQFIEAKLGYKPSFMWRSLLDAQDLIKIGMVWSVGNGRRISIWNDKWLPNSVNFQVRSPVSILAADAKVSSLIFEDFHYWNGRLICEIFSREDAAQIYSLPLSRYVEDDKSFWGFTKDERFSVRSAYHLGTDMEKADHGECSIRQK